MTITTKTAAEKKRDDADFYVKLGPHPSTSSSAKPEQAVSSGAK